MSAFFSACTYRSWTDSFGVRIAVQDDLSFHFHKPEKSVPNCWQIGLKPFTDLNFSMA
jgi:hypothetical protein